jgi:hypothetical protein
MQILMTALWPPISSESHASVRQRSHLFTSSLVALVVVPWIVTACMDAKTPTRLAPGGPRYGFTHQDSVRQGLVYAAARMAPSSGTTRRARRSAESISRSSIPRTDLPASSLPPPSCGASTPCPLGSSNSGAHPNLPKFRSSAPSTSRPHVFPAPHGSSSVR